MSKRVLRSTVGVKLLEVKTVEEVVTKKRKVTTTKVTKTSKSTSTKIPFEQWEEELKEKYPVPKDLKLPQSYRELHGAAFANGLEHLIKIDPTLYPIIVMAPFKNFHTDVKPLDTTQKHFEGLCRTIIGQQISGASARAIETRFKQHFGDRYPTPEQVLKSDDNMLREVCGLSVRKSQYVKSIANKFVSGEVGDKFFKEATNDEIIEKLVEMKGIGIWSAKMTLVFGLHRFDVFAHDDLGVARGISRYLKTRPHLLKEAKSAVDLKLFTKRSTFDDKKKRDWTVIHDAYVQYVADKFSPHRTALMLVMWRASGTDLGALESM